MSAHAKFLFNTEFGEDAQDDTPPPPTFSVEELEAVRAAAHAQGFEAGHAQAQAEFMATASQRIDQLMSQAGALARDIAATRDRMLAEATEIAFTCSRMLAETLISREPRAELLALFDECIMHMSDAPHIVVRVPGGDLEQLRDELKARAELHGCNGRIVVLAEEDMQPGDCRIEWADGGVSRDGAQLRRTLQRIIQARYPKGWAGVIPDHDEPSDIQEPPMSETSAGTAKEHGDE